MRLRTLLALAALLMLMCPGARAQEEGQKPDEQKPAEPVIDDFVLTRGVSFEEPGSVKKQQKAGTTARPPRVNNGSSSGNVASTKPPRKLRPIKGGTTGANSGNGAGTEI